MCTTDLVVLQYLRVLGDSIYTTVINSSLIIHPQLEMPFTERYKERRMVSPLMHGFQNAWIMLTAPKEGGDKCLPAQASVRCIVMSKTQNAIRLHVGILSTGRSCKYDLGEWCGTSWWKSLGHLFCLNDVLIYCALAPTRMFEKQETSLIQI